MRGIAGGGGRRDGGEDGVDRVLGPASSVRCLVNGHAQKISGTSDRETWKEWRVWMNMNVDAHRVYHSSHLRHLRGSGQGDAIEKDSVYLHFPMSARRRGKRESG